MGEPIQVGAPQTDGRRRLLMLAGGAAVVILAVLVLPGLLFGGGGGDVEDPTSFSVPPAPAAPVAPGEGAVPETMAAFSAKNPFEPLLDLAAAPPAEAPTDAADPTAPATTVVLPNESFPVVEGGGQATPAPSDPGAGGSAPDAAPGDVGGETTTTTAPPGPPPRQPDRVAMLEIFTDPGGQVVATIRVNDVVHQVAEGDEFATSYRVVSLDIRSRCGQLLFGDERFGLCEGDETLK